MTGPEEAKICPHCGKRIEKLPKRGRSDLYWEIKLRCPHIDEINVIDCTDEILDKIERHSWQRSKKKET